MLPKNLQEIKRGDQMIKVTSSIAENRLGDVPEDKRFLCCDGRIIKSLRELLTANYYDGRIS